MGTYLNNKIFLLIKQITNTVQTNGRVTIEQLTLHLETLYLIDRNKKNVNVVK